MSSRESEKLDLRHVGEVAAVVARNAQAVLDSGRCLANPALQTYWQASRQRADLWQFALDNASEASRRDQPLGKHTVRAVASVIAEVLSTELVTRLWTAVLVGHERVHGTHHEALARRVLSDHLTARRSCLRLLTHPIALPSSDIVTLNRIRQRAERWTDCLLATLPAVCEPEEFAFDIDRFNEFSEDSDVMSKISSRFSGWHLLALSLRVAENDGPETNKARNAFHREVLDSIGAVIDAAGASGDSVVADPFVEEAEEALKVRFDDSDSTEAIDTTDDSPLSNPTLDAVLAANFENDESESDGVAVSHEAEELSDDEPVSPVDTGASGEGLLKDVPVRDIITGMEQIGLREMNIVPMFDSLKPRRTHGTTDSDSNGRAEPHDDENDGVEPVQRLLPYSEDLGLTEIHEPKVTVTNDGLQFRTLFPPRR